MGTMPMTSNMSDPMVGMMDEMMSMMEGMHGSMWGSAQRLLTLGMIRALMTLTTKARAAANTAHYRFRRCPAALVNNNVNASGSHLQVNEDETRCLYYDDAPAASEHRVLKCVRSPGLGIARGCGQKRFCTRLHKNSRSCLCIPTCAAPSQYRPSCHRLDLLLLGPYAFFSCMF